MLISKDYFQYTRVIKVQCILSILRIRIVNRHRTIIKKKTIDYKFTSILLI